MVGLLVVGLLAVAGPATAQLADPLSLAASGVLLPYFGSGTNLSIIELASPVSENPNLHMIFYNANCTRVISRPEPLSTNDLTLVVVPGSPGVPTPGINGLVAVAETLNDNDLVPLSNPLHTRVNWIDLASGRSRVLEPITVDTFAVSGLVVWNPLRSGATFFAPRNTAPIASIIYLICPKTSIQGAAGPPVPAFPVAAGFPAIVPPFLPAYPNGSIGGRVYNTDENLLTNITTDCDCLQIKPLVDAAGGFGGAGAVYAAQDTYTELFAATGAAPQSGFGFTGYRAITIFGPGAGPDFFGRLSNAQGTQLLNPPVSTGNLR
jgi:hypothetical protein